MPLIAEEPPAIPHVSPAPSVVPWLYSSKGAIAGATESVYNDWHMLSWSNGWCTCVPS